MKCTIPEISWHNRDPVLSVDVQSGKEDDFYRLASGGTDSHVVVWHLRVKENGMAEVSFVADLQRHQRAVNTVRFSPSGEFLASGDDESAIIIWKQKTEQDAPELPPSGAETNAEQWLLVKILRGHVEDVYDLCWSQDSTCLISGSVDNTAILWDVQKGRHTAILSDHKGFVQGVAWDPKNQYVATLSSDRTCRVFNLHTRKVVCRASKAPLPVAEGSDAELDGKPLRLFYDDTLKSFFRRLAFSPDGELLFTPSGIVESPDTNKHGNATHVFMRRMFNRPVMYLPSPDHYTIAVRCCPTLFKLHDEDSMFALPYRMVVAIATQSSVVLYDTQQPEPFGIISNIHYTRLTDLAWSSDGRVLLVASTDGYCSIVTFSKGELGEEYIPVESTAAPTNSSTPLDQQEVGNVQQDEIVIDSEEKVPAISVTKETNTIELKPESGSSEFNESKVATNDTKVGEEVAKKKQVRRIQPITLSSKISPRKPKDVTVCRNASEASPSERISTFFSKLQNNEASKDAAPPCKTVMVKHNSMDESEVMDVDNGAASNKLDARVGSDVCLASGEMLDETSPAEVVSLLEGNKENISKCEDPETKKVPCGGLPSDTSVADDSCISEILKPVGVATCEVLAQENPCAGNSAVLSSKSECEDFEKMDIDVVEVSAIPPDKEEITDKSSAVNDVGCESAGCLSEQNSGGTIALEPSAVESSESRHIHKTPSKSEADGKPGTVSGTTPGSRSEGNANTPTESPVPQAKKTPRRVQLITLSSPKSKRSLQLQS